jgi:hypothetical protein
MFFQCCTSHGLLLILKDIFAARKTTKGRVPEPTYPDGFPFESLVQFAVNHNHRLVKVKLSGLQKLQRLPALAKQAPTRWGSIQPCFESVLKSEHILHSIVNQRDFVSSVNTVVHKAERERIKGIIGNSKFRDLLIKSLAILKPIDALIVKYQSDAIPVSDALPDFHQLPKKFEGQAGDFLCDEELHYLVAICKNRFNFLYGDAHGLSYLLDPLDIGHSLTQLERNSLEDKLTSTCIDGTVPTSDQHKKDVLMHCDQYRISATKEKLENSIRFQLLSSRVDSVGLGDRRGCDECKEWPESTCFIEY